MNILMGVWFVNEFFKGLYFPAAIDMAERHDDMLTKRTQVHSSVRTSVEFTRHTLRLFALK